jgi:HlyD family secretion protein
VTGRRRFLIGAGVTALLLTSTVIAFNAGDGRSDDAIPVMTLRSEDLQRRVTAAGVLEAENATPVNVPVEAQGAVKIGWIAEDQTAVKKGDVVVRFDPTEFEDSLRKGTDERTSSDNRLQKSTADFGAQSEGLALDADHARLELETARRFSREETDIFSRFEQVESQIDEGLASEKKRYADEVRGIREALATADRDLIGIDLRKAQMSIDRAEKGLRALTVAAPHDGILVLERDWRGELPKVGSTVWPGRPIAEIPAMGSFKAEVYVLEADATGIEVGQKATVIVEAAPGRSFPATVTRVDKVAKPRMRGVPVQYFGVTVKLDGSDPKVMKPGARARASIEVANAKKVVLVPRQAIFDVKGKRVVYVRRGDDFAPVPVETGLSTTGRIVITSGLKAGEVIALSDPTATGRSNAKGSA